MKILFKRTLNEIILLFHDIAGLGMNLEEWKQLCRKAWESQYDHLQIDRFAKTGGGRYTIRNCNKNTYIEYIPETKAFYFLYINMIYSIKNKDEIKDLEELEELQSKIKQVGLVEKLGKQGYHYDIKKFFEPITNTIKDVSEDVTRTMIESSKENNKTLTTLNNKRLEIMNDSV